MTVIGTAYVNVRAITDKLRSDVEDGLSGSSPAAEKAGEEIGQSLIIGAKRKTSGVSIGDDLDFSGVSRAAESAGEDAGRDLADGAQRGLEDGADDLEQAAGDAGDSAGRGLGNRFASGVSGSGAEGALGGLALKIIALGPVIAVAVAALSSLVSGLFALASAVAPAIASLAVLPGLLAGIGQGALAGVAAFGGIGAALKAGTKAMTAASGAAGASGASAQAAARAQERAAEAVKNAQQQIGNATREAATQQITSAEEVAKAQRDLTAAQVAVTASQVALNKARADAIEQIKQLNFSVEDATIAEKQAALDLNTQQQNYARYLALPPDNKLREQALLNLQQADLNYQEAVDKTAQLTAQQTASNKAGVEGSTLVITAKKKEQDAEQSLADAKQNLADQIRNQTNQQIQSAQAIASAQQNLKNAQEDLADANTKASAGSKAAATAANAYAAALKNLSPQAQAFVKYLISIQGQLKTLRADSGKQLFPDLTSAIKTLIGSGILKDLGSGLEESGAQIGLFAEQTAALSNDPFFRGNFSTTLKTDNSVLADLRKAIVPLISAFFSLLAAAAPTTKAFADFIAIKAQSIAAYTGVGKSAEQAAGSQAHLRDVIQSGADVAKQIGRIFSNVAGAIFALGSNARPAGQSLLDSLEGVTKRFKAFTQSPANDDKIKGYFKAVATNVDAISTLLDNLVKGFVRLGDQPGVKKVADVLTNDVGPALSTVASNFTNKYGPQIASTFASIVTAFQGFSDSPAFKVALGIIKAFADTLTFIVQTPGLRQIAFTIATALAAIKTIQKIGDFTGLKKLVGYFTSVQDFIKKKVLQQAAQDVQGLADKTSDIQLPDGAPTPPKQTSKFQFPGASGTASTVEKTTVEVEGAEKAGTELSQVDKAAGGLKGTMGGLLAALIPVSLPVIAIGAAVGALALILIGAYKNSAAFRDTINQLGDKLKPVAKAVEDFAQNALKKVGDFIALTLIPDIGKLITDVLPTFESAWNRISKAFSDNSGTFSAIGSVLKTVGEAIVKYVLPAIGALLLVMAKVEIVIDSTIISVLIDLIAMFIKVNVAIVKFTVGVIESFIHAAEAVNDKVSDIISFVVGLPAAIIKIAGDIFSFIGDSITDAVGTVALKIKNIVDDISNFAGRIAAAGGKMFDVVKTAIEAVRSYVSGKVSTIAGYFTGFAAREARGLSVMFNGVKTAIESARSYVSSKVDSIVGYFTGIGKRISSGVGGAFNGLISAFKSAVNSIIDIWNNLSFSLDIPKKVLGVTIPGGGAGFTISTPNIPHLAAGGTVSPTPDGTLVKLAEAGKKETVTPLDSNGRTKGDNDILAAIKELAGMDKNKNEITVFPSTGMNEVELANRVAVQLGWAIGGGR